MNKSAPVREVQNNSKFERTPLLTCLMMLYMSKRCLRVRLVWMNKGEALKKGKGGMDEHGGSSQKG